MHRLVLLSLLVASVIAGMWYALARPERVPPSPLAASEKVECISYAPFHGEQGPYDPSLRVPDAQIAADLEQLSPITSCVRTYSAAKGQAKITRLAGHYNLKVLQGIWLGRDRAENRREIEAALSLAKRHPGVVEAFIVGNEALLRGELSPADIRDYLQEVRRRGGLPVTYADVWEFWLKAPELADAVDFITIHILPYWEDDPVRASDAVAHVRDIRAKLAETFPGKDILIGEVGWPSQGRMRAGALPSPVNQARVLSGVVALAKDRGWKVNLIEAYDQPWKRLLEGTVGGYWGLFDDTARAPKFRWGESLSNHPRWRLEAGLGVAVAFLVFAAGWLGSRKQPAAAPTDFAVAAIALGAGIVFGQAVVEYPMGPPELGDRLRDLALVVLAAVVPPVAGYSLANGGRLPSFSMAVNPALWRRAGRANVLLAVLLVATVIAATHVALGLVFDPRYKDFLFASLTGPVAALALLAFASNRRPAHPAGDGVAEVAFGTLLAACALFIIYNEGVSNWQALWLAGLLLVLSLTVLRARAFDWSRSAFRTRPSLRAQPAPD
jgi:glucan 1,3-beta-glucosidase